MEFNGITTSADLFGMFNDTPQAASLMRYLVTADAQGIWPSLGGAVSGNSGSPWMFIRTKPHSDWLRH